MSDEKIPNDTPTTPSLVPEVIGKPRIDVSLAESRFRHGRAILGNQSRVREVQAVVRNDALTIAVPHYDEDWLSERSHEFDPSLAADVRRVALRATGNAPLIDVPAGCTRSAMFLWIDPSSVQPGDLVFEDVRFVGWDDDEDSVAHFSFLEENEIPAPEDRVALVRVHLSGAREALSLVDREVAYRAGLGALPEAIEKALDALDALVDALEGS